MTTPTTYTLIDKTTIHNHNQEGLYAHVVLEGAEDWEIARWILTHDSHDIGATYSTGGTDSNGYWTPNQFHLLRWSRNRGRTSELIINTIDDTEDITDENALEFLLKKHFEDAGFEHFLQYDHITVLKDSEVEVYIKSREEEEEENDENDE